MNSFYFLCAAFLFIITALDIIKTTHSSSGGGKITDAVSKGVWKGLYVAAGKNGRSKLLEYAGLGVLVSILTVWVFGLWAGVFVMLLSDPDSVLKSSTLASTDPLEKLYYAGFTLSTLGVGDYVASTNFWRIITTVAAFSGLAFITTSITYFIPVLSAVGLQSRLSLYINSLGTTPLQIVQNSWSGQDFSSFFNNTSDLCQMLMQHTVNHHSYPVIHFFHNSKPELAIVRAVVLLDEAHQFLKNVVKQDAGIDKLKLHMLQTALDEYLGMVKGSFIKNETPNEKAPKPDLSQLEASGVPLQEEKHSENASGQELQERRKLLTVLLEKDGWKWRDVYY